MLGFLLYLTTIPYLPHAFCLLLAVYGLIARRKEISINYRRNIHFVGAIVLFLFFCLLNSIAHGFQQIPNMFLLPVVLICAFSLKQEDCKVLVLLTIFECFAGFYEYAVGVNGILPGVENSDLLEEETLLYFKRVNGLSPNSSTFAAKLFYSTVILFTFSSIFTKRLKVIIVGILLGGFVITFNRTFIIATFFFITLHFWKELRMLARKRIVILLLIISIAIGIGVFVTINYGSTILIQFTRGGEDGALTGRDYIWAQFFSFISENFLLGNGSGHLKVSYYSGQIHAHNSFIQMLADHGIILFSFYLILILSKINRNNRSVVFSLFIASLTQYTLFWGFSLADVIMMSFLCNNYIYECKFATESRKRAVKLKNNISNLSLETFHQ